MAAHALLSPSSASRWLACTPSARLEQAFPNRAGVAAAEGTLAHELAENKIKLAVGLQNGKQFNAAFKHIKENSLYNNEMEAYITEYTDYVVEQFENAKAHTKDAKIFLETKLDMTDYVPEGFGTGDVIIVADRVLDFIDLKYGKGVPVDATENKQMMLYALGALKEYGFLYDVDTIRMTIYQPRLDSVSVWSITVADLLDWAESVLKPKAKMAFEGEGLHVPGKHCQFCKGKALCRANAEFQLEIARKEFTAPELLTDEEVSEIITRAKGLITWLEAVKTYAMLEAIHSDKKWPGFKLVEGRSTRVVSDEKGLVDVLKEVVSEEELYTKKLLGLGAMEKLVGKTKFATIAAPYLAKPPGSPTLAAEDDPRPVYQSNSAASDFSDDFAEE